MSFPKKRTLITESYRMGGKHENQGFSEKTIDGIIKHDGIKNLRLSNAGSNKNLSSLPFLSCANRCCLCY